MYNAKETFEYILSLEMLTLMQTHKISKFRMNGIEIEMDHKPEPQVWTIPQTQSLEVKPVTDDDILNNPLAGLSIDPFSRKED